MENEVIAGRRGPILVALVGLACVSAYAVAGAWQILVWNPLAAVPGASLAEITAAMEAVGKSLNAPVVIGWAAVGIVLAVGVLAGALGRKKFSAERALVLSLMLLLLAAPAHWVVSFAPGMMLADTFLIDGGDHAPWGMLLYGVSAVAGLALIVLTIMASARPAPRPR